MKIAMVVIRYFETVIKVFMAVIKYLETVITSCMTVIRNTKSVINYLSDSTNKRSYGKLRAVHVEGVTEYD